MPTFHRPSTNPPQNFHRLSVAEFVGLAHNRKYRTPRKGLSLRAILGWVWFPLSVFVVGCCARLVFLAEMRIGILGISLA